MDAPTCQRCGCLVGDRDRHADFCRRYKPLGSSDCSATTGIRDARGYPRTLQCGVSGEHNLHSGEYEGYRYAWYAREPIGEATTPSP